MKYLLLLFILLLPFSANALEINGLKVEIIENGEHVSIHLNNKTDYKVFLTETPPPRVVVDLPIASWVNNVGLPEDYNGRLIKKVRFGFHDTKTSRLVFDLNEGVKLKNITLIHKNASYRLQFDLIANPGKKEKIAAVVKPMIVIDAGHGGQDPGTSGYAGSEEKDLTLEYALALKDALLTTDRYNVALTRSDDRYLLLAERVRRARLAHGNLFISIHADSAPFDSARGLSVYTISDKASDKQSEALAAKENKADVIGGMDLSDTSKDVADILIDLTERETKLKSMKFADLLVKYIGHQITLLNHTHRFAGFAVLKAPDIPSVLIEVGFLTNQHEEHMLQTSEHKEKFVRGVVNAIDAYFKKKNTSIK